MSAQGRSLERIARAMEKAQAVARPAMLTNFLHADWLMSPEEFIAFWGEVRIAAVATVGQSNWPHAAPVEVALEGDRFLVPTYDNSVRMSDLRVNPRLVLTTWDDAWHAAIVHGVARLPQVPTENPPLLVQAERIYAIRAPEGHPAFRG